MLTGLWMVSDFVVMLADLWAVSDFAVMLAASSLILCLLLAGTKRCMEELEEKMDRGQEIRWLKASLLYLLFLLPVITEAVLFTRTYRDLTPTESFGKPYIMRTIVRESFTTAHLAFSKHWIFWLVLLVWGAGFLYFGVYQRRREKRALKCLREMSRQVEEGWLWELAEKLCRELEVRRPVCLYTNGLVVSPFVEGKKIYHVYLPEGLQDRAETELMLRHELTHCACGDTRYREYLHWLCALYWFLPPAYRFAERFVEVNEMACDEAVLREAPPNSRYRYAKLIYDLAVEEEEGTLTGIGFTFPGQEGSTLEKRVENMARKRSCMNKRRAVVLTAALLAACPVMTMAAADGVSIAQDALANALITETELPPMRIPDYKEVRETDSQKILRRAPDMEEMETSLETEDSAEIDMVIRGKESLAVAEVYLSEGDDIFIKLEGSHMADQFRLGREDSSKTRVHIDSVDGAIWYEWIVPESGIYTIYVEGTTILDVYLYGFIIIS